MQILEISAECPWEIIILCLPLRTPDTHLIKWPHSLSGDQTTILPIYSHL